MAISRTKTWSFAEKLTAAQLNAVDENITNALDKRGGEADTLASAVTVGSGGTIDVATGSTVTMSSGGSLIIASGGTEVVSSGGAVTVASGGTLNVNGSEIVGSGGSLTSETGSTVTLNGTVAINEPAIVGGTVANSVISGGTISVPTISAGTLSTTTADVGTLAVSGDATVTGNLTVGGVTSTGGSSTNSSLSNATITASSISTSTFSGGTISAATITGGSVGAASGLATLDGSSKVTAAQRTGWTVGSYFSRLATTFSTSSTTFVSPTSGLNCAVLNCVAGDILIIDAHFIGTVPIVENMFARLNIFDTATSLDTSEVKSSNAAVAYGTNTMAMSYRYTVVNAGTVTVYGQVRVGSNTGTFYGASSGNDIGSCSIRVLHYRP